MMVFKVMPKPKYGFNKIRQDKIESQEGTFSITAAQEKTKQVDRNSRRHR